MDNLIGKTILHYRIESQLGKGGMGMVYRAEDIRLGRPVALKLLPTTISNNEPERERFLIEARAAAALNHPYIAHVYVVEELDDPQLGKQLFIVMEYIDGRELREIIQSGIPNPQSAIDYAIQIAGGLLAAHAKGIVHRDIKPSNIMITETDQVKIMDFGLAKFVGSSAPASHLTQTGTTLGTVPYMSPEQVRGEEVDQRTDIWSFGVILYELLTGQHPFAQSYEAAQLYAIVNEPYEPPTQLNPQLPAAVDTIIAKMLGKSPEERYAGMDEVLHDLHQVDSPNGIPAFVGTTGGSNRSLVRKLPFSGKVTPMPLWSWLSRAALLVIIVGGLVFVANLVWRWNQPHALPVLSEKRIVVLPIRNGEDAGKDRAFCDGLTELLTSTLTQIEGTQNALWVVPSTEVRNSRVRTAGAAQQKFNANLVITGSLQRSENALSLTLNLIDARSLRQLKSVVVHKGMQSISEFQKDVVNHLQQMLELPIQTENQRVLLAGVTTSSGAYEYYLQGKGLLLNYDKPENVEQAIQQFQMAIREDSLYALAFAGLGEAFWRRYEYRKDPKMAAEAVQYCQRALELDSYLTEVHLTLGIIYRGTGKYDLSVQEFEQVLKSEPYNSDAYRELASTYARKGDNSRVEKMYLKAIELHRNYWATYYDLGRFYYRGGDYQKAAQQFSRVTEMAPSNFKAFRNLGVVYLLMGNIKDARKMLEESIRIHPNYGAYSNLGTILFMQQEYAQAARMYEKALEENDRFYALWGNLASCYELIPDESYKATPTYQRAIKLAAEQLSVNPNDARVLKSIASYYANLNNKPKAITYINQAVSLAPDNLEVLFRAAEVYGLLGDMDQAYDFLETVVSRGYPVKMVEQSPTFKEFHEQPRYRKIIAMGKHTREN